jgi:hypothetical protein
MPHQEWRDSKGVLCPSVTEITGLYTSKEMLEFRGDVGNKKFDDVMRMAGAIGTRTHAIIEDIMDRGEPTGAPFSEEKEAYMADQALAWVKANVERVVAQEQGLFSAKYRYGGTMDLAVRMKRDTHSVWIVDWKTSTCIYPTMGIQMAAYANLVNESMGWDWANGVDTGLILRLDKKSGGEPEERVFHNLDKYFEAFKGLRVLYDVIHGQGDFANGGAVQ